jgi:hypothetical protein
MVPFTDTDVVNRGTPGQAMDKDTLVDHLEDVESILIAQHQRMPKTHAADVPIYENTKKSLIQSVQCLIFNALLAACAEQEGFKNFENNSVYICHKDDYTLISKAQLVLL